MAENGEQLRCYCRRRPLLALCGRDAKTGEPYVHVKAFRQDRIYAEVVATAGDVRIRCRECLRWFTVKIRHTKLSVHEEDLPDGVELVRN